MTREPDIIERLRAHSGAVSGGWIMKDAAAEIERLRAALQEIAELSSVSVRAPHIARAALEHKP